MSNFTSIANEMAKKLVRAKNKNYALTNILYEINYLVYAETQKPLAYKAKMTIMRTIFDLIAGRKQFKLVDNEKKIVQNLSDIIIFYEKKEFISKQLKSGLQQLEERD